MDDHAEIKGRYRYEQDSKRFHRFQIETDCGIVGMVYIPKDLEPMPQTLKLVYAGREEAQS